LSTEGMTIDDVARLREAARDRIGAALPSLRASIGASAPGEDYAAST
jgi:hypothetical protein